jgi:hypothetical protein
LAHIHKTKKKLNELLDKNQLDPDIEKEIEKADEELRKAEESARKENIS